MIPFFGVVQAYGGYTSEYYNAMGFYVLGEFEVFHVFFYRHL